MVLKSKKTRSIFSRIKGLIFVIVSYSIYQIIKQKDEKIEDIWRIIQHIFQKENALLLIVVFLLIPINWALEALKWQKLAQKIEKISFFEAYRGVLVGLALATTTPLMIGDYVGKIWMLRTDRRLESIGAILLGNSIQTFVSLLFGTVSYVAFIWLNRDTYFWIHVYLVCTLIVSMIFGFWAVSNRHKINFLFDRFKFFRLFRRYLAVFQNYSLSEIRQILLIGICRYLVFTTQFIILLIVFDIQLPIPTLFYGVCLIFLSRTLASTLSFIGDLSVRELTSLYYFSHFAVSALTISTATLMIWLINVLFPIIVGVFFIWQLRISVKE